VRRLRKITRRREMTTGRVPTIAVLSERSIIADFHTRACHGGCYTTNEQCDLLIELGDRLIAGELCDSDMVVELFILVLLLPQYRSCLKVYTLNYLRHPSLMEKTEVRGVVELYMKTVSNKKVVDEAVRFSTYHSVFSKYLKGL
jgi:hypothetical protein